MAAINISAEFAADVETRGDLLPHFCIAIRGRQGGCLWGCDAAVPSRRQFRARCTGDDYAAMVRVGWASRPPARADGDAEGDRGGSPKVQDIVDQGSTVNKPDILAVTAARADCGFLISDCGISAGRA